MVRKRRLSRFALRQIGLRADQAEQAGMLVGVDIGVAKRDLEQLSSVRFGHRVGGNASSSRATSILYPSTPSALRDDGFTQKFSSRLVSLKCAHIPLVVEILRG